MKQIIYSLLALVALNACNSNTKTENSTEVQEKEDWIILFDGTTTEGWRAYNGDELPPGWIIKNGELTFDTELGLEQDYTGGKDIIYGAEEFENFELYLEWKLPKGGNSGIFYHLPEVPGMSPSVLAPEYQLIDDENYASMHDLTSYNKKMGETENLDQLQDWQKTASDYAMYPADQSQVDLNPVGEWNSSKIVYTPEKVEYWLNGKVVVSFVPGSEDWETRKNSGKWSNAPDYAKAKKGYIGLQDHSSPIWFKNIKIKKL
ncbi:3-keto-disaccharide hydrolase [Cyclobacterium marinum]|uniref:3-keto-alpha-glucoside-1,2-lyase/3-keto-2-hydroxy-glucal hydratase domain-containing protein n=1 Tax=Cyclobacterium marinum (strain ATCC 25205 / DSM 745 / LMG 13164 / NCIMB 1802) TaxID=880070 RepID=G0J4S6_CYCMS|nr:DUF1080 domain-containing protein [Cyclobacterium marinum]AEL25306.1 protein of unknown function DUF1080 [Cyclobacterium marinum DSM 745]MBI0400617.1 DUF1080 domain-containing protein [Cyclobacterium marinum]|tara:strand:+ start:58762 stop:59544 length:783 start_codon:yes stop_codon:yes gene_type:complete